MIVKMSDRRPVSVDTDEWLLEASARSWHPAAMECQANIIWTLVVRVHADGRALVYGHQRAGDGGVPAGWAGQAAGYLLDPGESVPDTLRQVAGEVGCPGLAQVAIADLRPEKL